MLLPKVHRSPSVDGTFAPSDRERVLVPSGPRARTDQAQAQAEDDVRSPEIPTSPIDAPALPEVARRPSFPVEGLSIVRARTSSIDG